MDIIFYNILASFVCLLIGYIFGSFPSGVVIGWISKKKDPRNYGSNNSGGTNVSRLWGFKVGVWVYILDFLKLAIPLWATWAILTFVKFGDLPLIPDFDHLISGNTQGYIVQWPIYWLVILGCGIGHCWPVFAKFKGGKAAAVTFSAAYFSSWLTCIVAFATFSITLKMRKFVSLASIVGSISASVAAWLTCIPAIGKYLMWGPTLCPGWIFALIMTLTTILLIIRHKTNIKRLHDDEERRITWLG